MNSRRTQARPATSGDDAALRALLRHTTLPGALGVTLEREPSFFGADVDAARHDVAYVEKDGALVACGSRLLKHCWWGGREALSAYYADLRVHPDHQRRGGWALRAGFRHLQEAAATHPADVAWTVVFEENQAARRVLVGRSGGLPAYADRGRLLAPVLLVPRRAALPPAPPGGELLISPSGLPHDVSWEEVAAFLNERGRARLLAPRHTAADLAGGSRWPGLHAAPWVLLRQSGRLAGCAALWDLRSLRQVRVQAWRGGWRWGRILVEAAARLAGFPALPRIGAVLPLAHVACLAVAGDEVLAARALLGALRAIAAGRGIDFICACLHENDPLAPALRGWPAIASHGRLYELTPPGMESVWLPGVPRVESAAL